jgi:2-polyprenyl-6-methoxyphenol hydroxylase-like FAD-dependent oxidoreductase
LSGVNESKNISSWIDCDVMVVGAGPVGMLQAIMLHDAGYKVVIIDSRTSINQHSRAIGIHPPGLASLDLVGVAEAFVERGKAVQGGWAYVDGNPVGKMRFDSNPGKWKYPIVMPQHATEEILEQALASRNMHRYFGCTFLGFEQTDRLVTVYVRDGSSNLCTITCKLLVGCDGKRSEVRLAMGSTQGGGKYHDRYMMGDFRDDGMFGDDALINLHYEGLVESFPLPGSKRRWVARLRTNCDVEATIQHLIHTVVSRMSPEIALEDCSMFSTFGIERWRTDKIVSGRVVLAGDAAHVVSPIGGQGMNLGWMDNSDLTKLIVEVESLDDSALLTIALAKYEKRVQRRAKSGIRRAWFNTMMGRPGRPTFLTLAATHIIVNTGMQKHFARRFTMLDL